MKQYSFVAWVLNLKNITRWHQRLSIISEHNASHSFDVSVIAHIIACIGVAKYNKKYNPEKIAVTAIYHEISETEVGDIPSPIKYANAAITTAIKKLENETEEKLVHQALPDYLSPFLKDIAIQSNISSDIKQIVKAADDISAYIKTSQEIALNNLDYLEAESEIKIKLERHINNLPEVADFVDNHLSACLKTPKSLGSLIKG